MIFSFPVLLTRSVTKATESGKRNIFPCVQQGKFFRIYCKKCLTKSYVCDKILLPLVNGYFKLCIHTRNSEFIEKAGATICTQLLKPAESSIR